MTDYQTKCFQLLSESSCFSLVACVLEKSVNFTHWLQTQTPFLAKKSTYCIFPGVYATLKIAELRCVGKEAVDSLSARNFTHLANSHSMQNNWISTVLRYHSVKAEGNYLTLWSAEAHRIIWSWYTGRTAKRGLGGAAAHPGPSLLYQM